MRPTMWRIPTFSSGYGRWSERVARSEEVWHCGCCSAATDTRSRMPTQVPLERGRTPVTQVARRVWSCRCGLDGPTWTRTRTRTRRELAVHHTVCSPRDRRPLIRSDMIFPPRCVALSLTDSAVILSGTENYCTLFSKARVTGTEAPLQTVTLEVS